MATWLSFRDWLAPTRTVSEIKQKQCFTFAPRFYLQIGRKAIYLGENLKPHMSATEN